MLNLLKNFNHLSIINAFPVEFLDLAPNEQDEAVIQEVRLNAESLNFTNKSECIFDKNKYIVINDLLDYLDQYIFAKTFVDLSKIENYMHISLENYSEKTLDGIYEEKISSKENMVDFSLCDK